MKTTTIISTLVLLAAIVSQSCTKNYNRIEGLGQVTTEILDLETFDAINLEGADHVDIQYGPQQVVEVTGHPNIISLVKREVRNGTWYMGLENGNYGHYELRYTLTLPELSGASITGSSDVKILNSLESENLELILIGSGSFYGFGLNCRKCSVEIIGSGDCEITADEQLDVIIEGSGSVFYKGDPSITTDISGSGKVLNSN